MRFSYVSIHIEASMTHSLRLFSAAALTAAVCAVGIASASSAAAAAELKIGVVNMERILRESKTAIEASDRLNAEGQRRQEEIEGISVVLRAALNALRKMPLRWMRRLACRSVGHWRKWNAT